MQRKLDQDAKLQEFFGVKGNRRVNVELEMREANRKLMQQEMIENHLNDLESILNDIKVNWNYFYFRHSRSEWKMNIDSLTCLSTKEMMMSENLHSPPHIIFN